MEKENIYEDQKCILFRGWYPGKKVSWPYISERVKTQTDRKEVVIASEGEKGEKTSYWTRKKDLKENYLDRAPQATLRVDELAKLLG